jgi:AraC family transcriptional regulator of adaptative response/methylated-DNA-[protein]-cysteine methyltransferase
MKPHDSEFRERLYGPTLLHVDREFASEAERWTAVTARDVRALGQFFYAVTTTQVFCRPTCASRQPLRKNVRFFDSASAAETAGFRPCKRCRPSDEAMPSDQVDAVVKACRAIEESAVLLTADELAQIVSMSRFHFQRVFKLVTGLTPREYTLALQARRVREGLATEAPMADVIYDAGFASSGRFYETAPELLGMKPAALRAKGAGQDIRFAVGQSSMGAILVAATERGVCAILIDDDPQFLVKDLQRRFANATFRAGDEAFDQWVALVVGFVESPRLGLDLPLDIQGTAFQQRVWKALRDIPIGTTASYADIARAVGAPKAARAIAQACGANPIAVAIPCHRVVRADGDLSGYRWGVGRKRQLLALERPEHP